MSVNSKPKTLNNNQWVRDASEELANVGIATARLDAEIILAHTIHRSRTWIHAHGEEPLDARREEIANARLTLRLDRVPVAYIIGHKEFYSRLFRVTPSVLIPRPESEAVIELLKRHLPKHAISLIDIGTGSGCLGITAKLELPQLSVTLTDTSHYALTVAASNAALLGAEVTTIRSNLFTEIRLPNSQFDCIIANLPYVDTAWERSPETDHEPREALFAKDGGFALIGHLLAQATEYLLVSGLIVLEADPEQHQRIIRTAEAHGLRHIESDGYAVALTRTATS